MAADAPPGTGGSFTTVLAGGDGARPSTPLVDSTWLAVRCPRCGYELRGEVERWRDACPLAGRCNECGLEWGWSELLVAGLVPPRWHIECGRGLWPIPWQLVATAARACMTPFTLWTRVRMRHEIRAGRLLLLAAWWILLMDLALGVPRVVGNVHDFFDRGSAIFGGVGSATWSREAIATLTPALMPFIESDRGYCDLEYSGLAHEMVRGATFAIICSVVATATLLALPVTRRRCNVRGAHLWRVLAHAPSPWLPAILAPMLWSIFAIPTGNSSAMGLNYCDVETQWMVDVLWFGGIVATPLWWCAAVRRYLRLPHAVATGCLCAAAGLIAALAASAAAGQLERLLATTWGVSRWIVAILAVAVVMAMDVVRGGRKAAPPP